jgi:transposase-like protein
MAKGKPFAPGFRQEAAQLYRVRRRRFRAVADDLGVAPESLRRWVLKAEIDEGKERAFERRARGAAPAAARERSAA